MTFKSIQSGTVEQAIAVRLLPSTGARSTSQRLLVQFVFTVLYEITTTNFASHLFRCINVSLLELSVIVTDGFVFKSCSIQAVVS